MTAARKPSPVRNVELAKIHIAAQQLGMEEDTYRDMLWSVGRVRSAKDLDLAGRQAVLAHLVACGFRDTSHQRGRRPGHAAPTYKKSSQAALIRHLWTRLAQAGQVHDGSDRALRAYVHGQSAPHHPQHVGWDDPRLLPRPVAGLVIEHMKQWCDRAGVERR